MSVRRRTSRPLMGRCRGAPIRFQSRQRRIRPASLEDDRSPRRRVPNGEIYLHQFLPILAHIIPQFLDAGRLEPLPRNWPVLQRFKCACRGAQTTFNSALASYRNRVGSITDVNIVQTQLLLARNASTDAYSTALSAAATLASATGALGSGPGQKRATQLSAPFQNLLISFLQARVKARSKSNSFTALGLIFEYFISSTK